MTFRRYRLLIILTAICLASILSTSGSYSQVAVDYQSLIMTGNTSERIIGNGYDKLGPYTAYGLVWVFYSDGTQGAWRTKLAEPGGTWSSANHIFPLTDAKKFNVHFDGKYFHIIRSLNGNLLYKRGLAQSDGSIIFDQEQTAYSHGTWDVQENNIFDVYIDRNGHPWILIGVINPSLSRKPVLLSSIDTTGSWVNRPGFPKDMQVASTNQYHGHGTSIVEIDNGKILIVWRNGVDHRMSARLWTADANPEAEGTLGDMEITDLPSESARMSALSPATGIAMLNANQLVARRNANGTWETVTPPVGLQESYWNSMSYKDGVVRLWDIDASKNVRYRETSNNGTTWSDIVTKYPVGNAVQVNASDVRNSSGSHHSVLIATGSGGQFDPPYGLIMGIEGTLPVPNPPSLVSPANGAVDQPGNIIFRWNAVSSAASYHLQVSKTVDFSSSEVDQTGITDTLYNVSELELNVTFYWRVRSATPGGSHGDWSAVWDFNTVGLPPAPSLVSPANNVQDQPVALDLVWNPAVGAETYQLQVATVMDFSSTFINLDGLTDTLSSVDGLDFERTYYWRVRAKNSFGDGSWSQVRNFTTRTGIPAPPVLSSPDDASTNVSISPSFSWQASSGADTYRLQISKVSDFSSTVQNVGSIASTSYQVTTLENSTTYYWRVNATNASGTSGWSQVRSFTTIIAIPTVPVLVMPVNLAESVSTKPLLDWTESERAESYRLQVASDTLFNNVVLNVENIEGTSHSIANELNEFTAYYWRVNATNVGGTSDWSAVSKFTTGQAFPVAPVLVSPESGTTDVTNTLFLWNAVATATQYHIQISETSDFSTTTVDNNAVMNTFYTTTSLVKFTQYYWRVRAISPVGAGDWSSVWNFTTGDIVSVERIDNELPAHFALSQNYPNPFNPTTSIRFSLPTEASVRLEVYNMLGQRIATLIDGAMYHAGNYQYTWDGQDDSGNSVSSGMYIYRITAGEYSELKRMILMK
jgi:hypothetical protein